MSYRIDYRRKALRELKTLPGHVRAEARKTIRSLKSDPRPSSAQELRGKPNIYRIWLSGRWRLAYEVDDEKERARILRVRLKEQIDYPSLSSELRQPVAIYDSPRSIEKILTLLRSALRLDDG